MVKVTLAKPFALRSVVPLKITSSIFEQRSVLTDCSPNTQRIASLMLLFPLPFGPTTVVMPLSNVSTVFSGNVLKPCSSSDFNSTFSPATFLLSRAQGATHSIAHQLQGLFRRALLGLALTFAVALAYHVVIEANLHPKALIMIGAGLVD